MPRLAQHLNHASPPLFDIIGVMKTNDILTNCIDLLNEHIKRGSTLDLFKALYPYPLDDINNIAYNIQLVDTHTEKTLLDKVDKAFMDLKKIPETKGEALMFRLRLENAIRIITILSKGKTPCEVKTTIEEEAVYWALTTLWKCSNVQWIYRTAQAFYDGKPSAIPWPLPV